MSHIIIIAGPNGAGKTTAAPALLNGALHIHDFVNADTIAQGLCAFFPETAAIQAGRIMLNRMHHLADQNKSFAFETTLASRSFAQWISTLKKKGYLFHLEYLWLNHPDLAVLRVQERIQLGGHFIPEETVRRRYLSSMKNFFHLYTPIANSWNLHDNSEKKNLICIATRKNNQLNVNEHTIWKMLVEKYDAIQ